MSWTQLVLLYPTIYERREKICQIYILLYYRTIILGVLLIINHYLKLLLLLFYIYEKSLHYSQLLFFIERGHCSGHKQYTGEDLQYIIVLLRQLQ